MIEAIIVYFILKYADATQALAVSLHSALLHFFSHLDSDFLQHSLLHFGPCALMVPADNTAAITNNIIFFIIEIVCLINGNLKDGDIY